MHQLLLLRHAKSSWEDDGTLADRDRPLNARGRRAAVAMRAAIREAGLAPDLVLVSPARRAMETMAALEPWDDTPLIEPTEDLYLAPAGRLLEAVQRTNETVRTVMVIGHNPGMHELAVMLLDHDAPPAPAVQKGFPTAALAVWSIAGPWQRLSRDSARLLRFITPKSLGVTD